MSERFARLKRLWSSLGRKSSVPHRPGWTASVLAALLAIGVVLGFVATRGNHAVNGAFASTTTTSTAPPATVPSTTTTSTTAPPPTTTTTAAAVASGLGPCAPSEVQLSVSTNQSTYSPGTYVTVTTAFTDVAPCVYSPESASNVSCPVYLYVDNSSGSQVWPLAGQSEDCTPPSEGTLSPSQQEVVRVEWNQAVAGPGGKTVQAAAGEYEAVAVWSWYAGSGVRPYEEQESSNFVVG